MTMVTDQKFLAPPIPNETSFYLRFLEDISGVRDAAGRPLHEVEFREELATVDIRLCPYPGSRHGYMMNQAALRIIAKDWNRIRGSLRFLIETACLDPFGDDVGTLIWARSLLPMFVPLYVLRMAYLAADEFMLPTDISGLFKVMLDVPTTVDLMLVEEWAQSTQLCSDYSPAAIATYAEKTGILNNDEWTCAGPPGLIADLLSLLWLSERTDQSDGSSMISLIAPTEFAAFSKTMIRQYALSQAFQASTSFLMEHAFARTVDGGSSPPTAAKTLSAYERRRRIVLGVCRDRAATSRVVSGFCKIATQLRAGGEVVVETSCAAMLEAITKSRRSSSAELLEAQTRVEDTLRIAMAALQVTACTDLGGHPTEVWHLDWSRLRRADFPTEVLRQQLHLEQHGS